MTCSGLGFPDPLERHLLTVWDTSLWQVTSQLHVSCRGRSTSLSRCLPSLASISSSALLQSVCHVPWDVAPCYLISLANVREHVQMQTHGSLNGLFDFSNLYTFFLSLKSISHYIIGGCQDAVQISAFSCKTFSNHPGQAI